MALGSPKGPISGTFGRTRKNFLFLGWRRRPAPGQEHLIGWISMVCLEAREFCPLPSLSQVEACLHSSTNAPSIVAILGCRLRPATARASVVAEKKPRNCSREGARRADICHRQLGSLCTHSPVKG